MMKSAHEIAHRAAVQLFTSGAGNSELAERLVLERREGPERIDLGGGCFDAVVRVIREEIEKANPPAPAGT